MKLIKQLQRVNNREKWECQCPACGAVVVRVCSNKRFLRDLQSCGCISRRGKNTPYKLTREEAVYRRKYNSYRSSAKTRNLPFDISLDQARSLFTEACHYCGMTDVVTPGQVGATGQETVVCNGIDRVDNTSGYLMSNCVACCKRCNIAKNDSTYEEFVTWIDSLAQHRRIRRLS